MYMDHSLPKRTILEISFLSRTDFYNLSFKNNNYRIIGGDKDIKTNLIGIREDGKVYYIITDENTLFYIAISVDAFVRELLLYDDYMNTNGDELPENPDDSQLFEFTDKFRKKILKLDSHAFDSEDTFWSEICEEMEYGMI